MVAQRFADGFGFAEEVALAVVDVVVQEIDHVFFLLDAFGDEVEAEAGQQLLEVCRVDAGACLRGVAEEQARRDLEVADLALAG